MSDDDYPTPPSWQLTSDEIAVIKETWKIPTANAHDSAEFIFYTFLEKYPENQAQFRAFRDKSLAELKGSPFFRAHASRIYNVFSSFVDNLGQDPDNKEIKKFIAEVGVFHAKKNVSKKSHSDLRGVIVDILSEVCKLDENGKAAWSKYLDIFFNVIFECIDGRADQFD